ncbi:MAG: hypothetical protein JO235_28900 [Chroococcidiopsidaceae cyanobacterium CP_BM_RX_35]|nr:hypothetical protein [Chroococcidiopsidaceae cyanobacterium CP_BM_RX_35]
MTRTNPPSYTAMSLQEALANIRKVYLSNHHHVIEKQEIAKVLSIGDPNACAEIITGLAEFGLLEAVGSQFRVAEDAIDIISLDQGEYVRVRALRSIAFTPYLFSRLYEAFGEKLPNDNILRSFLLKEGFIVKTATSVIRDYRNILEFLREEELASNSNVEDWQDPLPKTAKLNATTKPYHTLSDGSTKHQGSLRQTLIYRIAEDCSVQLQFDGPVAREGIEKLIALLQTNADVFPRKEPVLATV